MTVSWGLSTGAGVHELVSPQAGRSFSCPVLDKFNLYGSSAVALPKEMLDSLDAPVTGRCLSVTVVPKARRMVKVELARRDRIPCPDLIMRESMTMVPHLLRRLAGKKYKLQSS